MSSVHYKFRATIDLKTVRFEGLHILGSDLKREIYAKEKIKPEAFDLILQNSHTKRTYGNEEMVPRNATIIVQRVPKEGAEKLPKIPTGNGGLILRSGTGGDTSTSAGNEVIGHLDEIVMAHMTEEEKLAHMKSVSAMKYHSSNFQKRPKGIMTGVPPPTYVCNRCNQTGHWYNNCPTVSTKASVRVCGIRADPAKHSAYIYRFVCDVIAVGEVLRLSLFITIMAFVFELSCQATLLKRYNMLFLERILVN